MALLKYFLKFLHSLHIQTPKPNCLKKLGQMVKKLPNYGEKNPQNTEFCAMAQPLKIVFK